MYSCLLRLSTALAMITMASEPFAHAAGIQRGPVIARNAAPAQQADGAAMTYFQGYTQHARSWDANTKAVNFLATGQVPDSPQVASIRDTGPTDQEWVQAISGMYQLAQTTFNPYALLEGVVDPLRQKDQGQKLGVFLTYQLTNYVRLYGIESLNNGMDHDFLNWLFVGCGGNCFNDSIYLFAREWFNYFIENGADSRSSTKTFAQFCQEAGVKTLPQATKNTPEDPRRTWDNAFQWEARSGQDARNLQQAQAFMELKNYMEGDDRFLQSIMNNNGQIIQKDRYRYFDPLEAVFPPYMLARINAAFAKVKDPLHLRNIAYNGQDLFGAHFKAIQDKMVQDLGRANMDEIARREFRFEGKSEEFRNAIQTILNYMKWGNLNETGQALDALKQLFLSGDMTDDVLSHLSHLNGDRKKYKVSNAELPLDAYKNLLETKSQLLFEKNYWGDVSERRWENILPDPSWPQKLMSSFVNQNMLTPQSIRNISQFTKNRIKKLVGDDKRNVGFYAQQLQEFCQLLRAYYNGLINLKMKQGLYFPEQELIQPLENLARRLLENEETIIQSGVDAFNWN